MIAVLHEDARNVHAAGTDETGVLLERTWIRGSDAIDVEPRKLGGDLLCSARNSKAYPVEIDGKSAFEDAARTGNAGQSSISSRSGSSDSMKFVTRRTERSMGGSACSRWQCHIEEPNEDLPREMQVMPRRDGARQPRSTRRHTSYHNISVFG